MSKIWVLVGSLWLGPSSALAQTLEFPEDNYSIGGEEASWELVSEEPASSEAGLTQRHRGFRRTDAPHFLDVLIFSFPQGVPYGDPKYIRGIKNKILDDARRDLDRFRVRSGTQGELSGAPAYFFGYSGRLDGVDWQVWCAVVNADGRQYVLLYRLLNHTIAETTSESPLLAAFKFIEEPRSVGRPTTTVPEFIEAEELGRQAAEMEFWGIVLVVLGSPAVVALLVVVVWSMTGRRGSARLDLS